MLNLDMNELSESEVQKQLKINPNTGYKFYIASLKVCNFNQLLYNCIESICIRSKHKPK